MKSRFTCLDVHRACAELAPRVIGARLQNIYDINAKTFLLKLNPREGDEKLKLVVESGTRIHSTAYDFESAGVHPSFFAMRLRKWLRDRRITGFKQAGFDRVVQIEFGHQNPDMILNLYLEFFSAGNIVLTDGSGVILLILRVVINAEGESIQKIGSTYTLQPSKSLSECFDELKSAIAEEGDSAPLKKLVKERMPTFSNPMISHLCALAEKMSTLKAISSFKEAIESTEGGYLTLEQLGEEEVFIDFHAFPFSALESKPHRELPTFNGAVDEFFSNIQFQKGQKAQAQQEKEALSKIEAIRTEQANRIHGLEQLIELHLKRAQLLDADPKLVQDAITVIDAAVKAGMDWKALELTIKGEKAKGNYVAQIMKGLKLEKGFFTITLEDIDIDVDITLSPHANATRYYDLRKAAIDKLERTRVAMDKAMRSAEKKIRHDLRQSKTKAKRQQVFAKRKGLWFEKFNWFLSSDAFLVLAGRDMQQNELLVKRYLKEGDVYVHADMHGAASVIVKGRRVEGSDKFMTIPPRTLAEAGSMSLCNSRAWEAKIVTSAWWVHAAQVSKTAPSGEFLPTGSFMIRGKKNFLPPAQLLYGFGFVFVLGDEAKANQKLERLARDAQLQEGVSSDSVEDASKYLSMLDVEEQVIDQIDVTSNRPKKQVQAKQSKTQKGNNEAQAEAKDGKKGTTTRGAKGKQKKIAKKYGDQDEEERNLRMSLLASKKAAAAVEEKSALVKKEPVKTQKKSIEVNSSEPKVDTAPLDIDDEEAGPVVGEDELAIIDALTGNLRGSVEHVQYAIPVAGPITAMNNYTFRLKLAPGSLKRGKAVQQALSIFLSDARARELDLQTWSCFLEGKSAADTAAVWKSVKEMIRAVPDADLNQTMLGHVKIMASAKDLSKSKAEAKKSKKAK